MAAGITVAGGARECRRSRPMTRWTWSRVSVELGEDGSINIRAERALGRLGEGLTRLREERQLTQAEVARLAGGSASAISQAEAGLRGLSLETLLGLSEQLGVGIDAILGNVHDNDYVLARRDRSGGPSKQIPLLDDPKAGVRAYLVNLGSAESGAPPLHHKGPELVLVAGGLVQVDLGAETPVMRAGDALLASRVPVIGWRNLLVILRACSGSSETDGADGHPSVSRRKWH